MLDTNVCICLIKKKPLEISKRIQMVNVFDVCGFSITLGELDYGIQKSAKKEQNRLVLLEFITPINVLPFDDHAAAATNSKINIELEKNCDVTGAMDMLIAVHALHLTLNLLIITNSCRKFQKT